MYRLGQVREQHIRGHARACSPEGDDEIVWWVRARRLPDGKHGFAYITRERLVLCWLHGKVENRVVPWQDVTSWGVKLSEPGGPVLGVSTGGGAVVFQLPVPTHKKARALGTFLGEVSDRSKDAGQAPDGDLAGFEQPDSLVVLRERRSLAGYGRRALMTVAGLLLIVLGIVFASPFVPGPGTLTVLGGLALLAGEYDWAKDAHHWFRKKAQEWMERARQWWRARRRTKSGSGVSRR
ncbi:TIGR02611 family protein [Haloechinothrix alba]|uniref:TIGR02611 family protein n=1 Tax=Haloechinothrix alba TaxID=664784 RepID=A0A238Y199_9PSEU|nr:PGPGW domain-containing protein [Haloechinothrix alba]SNR64423.1 TIGR02611 family protein [Haloechinothrix alba]